MPGQVQRGSGMALLSETIPPKLLVAPISFCAGVYQMFRRKAEEQTYIVENVSLKFIQCSN